MLTYMLDNNICIYIIKNRPEQIREKFNQHHGRMCVSSVVASELYYGAAKSGIKRHYREVESFLNRIKIMPFDEFDSGIAGMLRGDLAKKGTPIGPYDVLIAGHAKARRLILVTNNTKEFERVEGLTLENWI